jgi:hypothetical protein
MLKPNQIAWITMVAAVISVLVLGLPILGINLPTRQAAPGLQLGCVMVKGWNPSGLSIVGGRFPETHWTGLPELTTSDFVIGLDETACQNLKFGDKYIWLAEARNDGSTPSYPIDGQIMVTKGAFSGQGMNAFAYPMYDIPGYGEPPAIIGHQYVFVVYGFEEGNPMVYIFPENPYPAPIPH